MSDPMLQVRDLCVAYGDVQVLWNVDLDIFPGDVVALVGSNGAGKTTLLWALSGLLKPRQGHITFQGTSLNNASTQQVVDLGIAHVPEGRRLFSAMSVKDNLRLGAFRRNDKASVDSDFERVLDMFPRLKDRRTALAGNLSGGEQQMVAIARALMAKPRLLLIDELSLGLAPVIVDNLLTIITEINKAGVTIMVVEQDIQVALALATRGYVLETGSITLSGSARSLLEDERVKQAYLGL